MKAPMTTTTGLLVVALLLFGADESHAEALKASVERNPIHVGESVRLVLELPTEPAKSEYQVEHRDK